MSPVCLNCVHGLGYAERRWCGACRWVARLPLAAAEKPEMHPAGLAVQTPVAAVAVKPEVVAVSVYTLLLDLLRFAGGSADPFLAEQSGPTS